MKILRAINSGQLFYMIPLFLILAFHPGCKKEEEPGIEILNLKSVTEVFERDTLKIQYYAAGKNLDSVCLLIDNQIRQKQNAGEKAMIFIPESRGAYSIRLKLNAYYKSGIVRSSETYYVNVSNLITPELYYDIKRDDGLSNYFVGEKLSITVKARYDFANLEDYRQVSVFLNDDSLGTRTGPPYTFISDVILKEQNQITVTLKDSNNRIHYVKQDFVVPVNTPPNIKLDFNYRHNIPAGYFFTSDSIITVLNGTDNVKITYVDYYLDDNLFVHKPFDTERIYYFSLGIGKLSAGTHSVYCIAIDDRGKSTKSAVLTIQVYHAIDLKNHICDVEYSDDEESVFLLSNSSLYIINPIREEVTAVIDFPFSDAKSMDFSATGNKLYIASKSGRLVCWSCTTQVLNEIPLTGISNIEDMEIDNEQNLALISNLKLIAVNLTSGKLINTWTSLDPGSTLIFDKVNKYIITGGNPHISRSYVYIYQLGADTLIYKKKADIGGYGYRLELNPNRTEFVISPNSNGNLINSYRTSDLSLYRTFQQQSASVSTFSTDGNYLFVSDSWDSILNIYDTRSLIRIKSFTIPLDDYDDFNFLLPNKNNTCLVVTTMNSMYPGEKVVFVRQN